MTILPLWFIFALAASAFSALGMYMHQRLNGSAVASAVWLKLVAVTIAVPALITFGLPDQPMFYAFTAAAAVIWCINDLIYFEAVKTHGAALIARLSPLGIIAAFVAWFFVKPDLLDRYMADLPRFAGVSMALLVAAICAMSLRHCAFSWRALKAIWPVIVATVIGTFCIKSAVDYAPANQGVFGYLGFEASCMLVFYTIYFSLFRRGAGQEIFSAQGLRTGGIVGLCLVGAVICRTYAQKNVDHPAFVVMISMLDVVWLIIMTRLSGWKDDSNKIAGLGIVIAAVALAFLKIR